MAEERVVPNAGEGEAVAFKMVEGAIPMPVEVEKRLRAITRHTVISDKDQIEGDVGLGRSVQ